MDKRIIDNLILASSKLLAKQEKNLRNQYLLTYQIDPAIGYKLPEGYKIKVLDFDTRDNKKHYLLQLSWALGLAVLSSTGETDLYCDLVIPYNDWKDRLVAGRKLGFLLNDTSLPDGENGQPVRVPYDLGERNLYRY